MKKLMIGVTLCTSFLIGCSNTVNEPYLGSNYLTSKENATFFRVDPPQVAPLANKPFKVTVWWFLNQGTARNYDQLDSAKAAVDVASKTISITGTVTRFNVSPGQPTPGPDDFLPSRASTISVEVEAPAGEYVLEIPNGYFYADIPTDTKTPTSDVNIPLPQATMSLTIGS